jgi:Fe2+ transport system protein FeoA
MTKLFLKHPVTKRLEDMGFEVVERIRVIESGGQERGLVKAVTTQLAV